MPDEIDHGAADSEVRPPAKRNAAGRIEAPRRHQETLATCRAKIIEIVRGPELAPHLTRDDVDEIDALAHACVHLFCIRGRERHRSIIFGQVATAVHTLSTWLPLGRHFQ